MNSVMCLEHLSSLYYHLGFGFFVFGNFKEMSEIFGLFLLLAFGLKSLYYNLFPSRSTTATTTTTTQILSDSSSERSVSLSVVSKKKMVGGSDGVSLSALKKSIEMERRRAEAAVAELERERAASASAAEEAMAMIQRLQNEKSAIEIEFNQYRRLIEAKRSHDEEMIQSLEWLAWRQEEEMTLFQEELRLLTTTSYNSC